MCSRVVECFCGPRGGQWSTRCSRCLLLSLNIVQALLSSLLLSLFVYGRALLVDAQQAEVMLEGKVEGLSGLLILGVVVAAVMLVTSSIGMLGVCCSCSYTNTLAIEAHVVLLCVSMVLEAATAVEIMQMKEANKRPLKPLGALLSCPACERFLFGSTGSLKVSAWVLLATLTLQIVVLLVAIKWTLAMRSIRHRRQRAQSAFLARANESVGCRPGIYKRFQSDSVHYHDRGVEVKMVTFSQCSTLSADEPLDLSTSTRNRV